LESKIDCFSSRRRTRSALRPANFRRRIRRPRPGRCAIAPGWCPAPRRPICDRCRRPIYRAPGGNPVLLQQRRVFSIKCRNRERARPLGGGVTRQQRMRDDSSASVARPWRRPSAGRKQRQAARLRGPADVPLLMGLVRAKVRLGSPWRSDAGRCSRPSLESDSRHRSRPRCGWPAFGRRRARRKLGAGGAQRAAIDGIVPARLSNISASPIPAPDPGGAIRK